MASDASGSLSLQERAGQSLVDSNVGMKSGSKWELSVTNGTYQVLVSVGDSNVAAANTVRVEGSTTFSAVKLAANAFSTKSVTVTDGKLTLDNGSTANLARYACLKRAVHGTWMLAL